MSATLYQSTSRHISEALNLQVLRSYYFHKPEHVRLNLMTISLRNESPHSLVYELYKVRHPPITKVH